MIVCRYLRKIILIFFKKTQCNFLRTSSTLCLNSENTQDFKIEVNELFLSRIAMYTVQGNPQRIGLKCRLKTIDKDRVRIRRHFSS